MVAEENEAERRDNGLSNLIDEGKKLYKVYRKHPEAYWPTVGFLGVQMCWAVQISYVSATFLTLGMDSTTLGFAWLAGPLGGIIMQPLAGVYSDYSENRFGRRRPYIIIGTLCSVIGLQGFSNAESLGMLFGDTPDYHPAGIVLSVIAFYFMDFAINYAMGPMVALLADVCDTEVYPYGQAWFAAHNGMGKTLGYAFGSIHLVGSPVFSWLGTDLRALYLIASLFAIGSCTLLVLNTREVPHKNPSGIKPPACMTACAKIWQGLRTMPTPIFRAFMVQCLTFFAWYPTFIYLATWMGETVYEGSSNENDENYDLYLQGVEATSLGYMGMAIVSIIWAMLLPMMGKTMGVKISWALNLVFFGIILVLFTTVELGQSSYAVCLITLLGFPLAGTYQIPWSIVTTVAQETPEKVALYTTIFNMSQCFPEIVVAIIGGIWIDLCGGQTSNIFILGTIGTFAAALLCSTVIQPEKLYDRTGALSSPSQTPGQIAPSKVPLPEEDDETSSLIENAF